MSRPPARRARALVLVEALAVAAWLGLLGWVLTRADESTLKGFDSSVLASGPATEQWMGIFLEGQPVGYSMTREAPARDGGKVLEFRSLLRVISLGEIQRVVTAGRALVDAGDRLQTFDFIMSSAAVRLAVRGEAREGSLLLEVHQGGEVREVELPVEERPQLAVTLASSLAGREFTVGQRFEVPYFDPVTLAQAPMQVEVTDVEVLPGTAEEAYWLTMRFGGVETRRLVTPGGDVIREEGNLGLSMVRVSRDEAEALVEGEPPDLVAAAAVRLQAPLAGARSSVIARLRVSGVDVARIPDAPPVQARQDDEVRVQIPLLQELPEVPLVADPSGEADPEVRAALESSLLTPSDHPDIQAAARQVLGGTTTRKAAAQALGDWVFAEVEKRPVLGVPNGLEVLRRREGDCNEHTALYVSLARAAGLPARIVAGLVYSEEVDGSPAFYYHAWPEVHLGGSPGWVPVDPTFGQFPADATHLKLVVGDLDRQVEIIGLMGRLRIEVLELR